MSVTCLTNLNLFDGERMLADQTITFDRDGIHYVGPEPDTSADAVQQTNANGAWLVPGLTDAHIHLELDPEDKVPPALDAPRDRDAMARRAKALVEAGITTARDLGGGAWAEFEIRDRINAGKLSGPRLLCAGQPVTSVGGHCHFWGGEASDLAQAEAVLAKQIEGGADLFKIMATGGRFTPNSSPSKAQFELSFMQALVQAANAAGLRVAAHCHGSEGIHHATHAGVTTIEHCSWVGDDGRWASDYLPDVAVEMARRGVWVSPTVGAGWQRFIDSDSDMIKKFRTCFDDMRANGVKLIASTDAGIPGVFHHQLPKALDVFRQIAGLSPLETLQSATANAADALGLADVTGRIQVGLAADLLLLEDNPLEDLTALQHPLAIWARGETVKGLD